MISINTFIKPGKKYINGLLEDGKPKKNGPIEYVSPWTCKDEKGFVYLWNGKFVGFNSLRDLTEEVKSE